MGLSLRSHGGVRDRFQATSAASLDPAAMSTGTAELSRGKYVQETGGANKGGTTVNMTAGQPANAKMAMPAIRQLKYSLKSHAGWFEVACLCKSLDCLPVHGRV